MSCVLARFSPYPLLANSVPLEFYLWALFCGFRFCSLEFYLFSELSVGTFLDRPPPLRVAYKWRGNRGAALDINRGKAPRSTELPEGNVRQVRELDQKLQRRYDP